MANIGFFIFLTKPIFSIFSKNFLNDLNFSLCPLIFFLNITIAKKAKLDKVKKLQQEIKMIEKKEEEKRIKEFLKELNGLSEQQIEKVRNFIQELKKETV